MRMVPRARRCGAALGLARATEPLFRLSELYRLQERSRVSGALDIATHMVLHTLTKNGVPLDPIFDFAGYDDFVRAYKEGCGILLVAAHNALSLLILRRFYDAGNPSVTNSSDALRVLGTSFDAPIIDASSAFLLATRSRLRRGEIVGAMLDRSEHHHDKDAERTFAFETANGPVIMAPALLHVAARCGARVVFVEAHAEPRGLAGTLVVASSSDVEGLTREYIDFVRAHLASRLAGTAPAQAEDAVGAAAS
jgi:hypothetical protein